VSSVVRLSIVAAATLTIATRSGSGADVAAPPSLTLDERLEAIAPDIRKWASVCVVARTPDGVPDFQWHSYRDTGDALDFWPASTIKLYAVIAALELLHARGFSLDTALLFEHREKNGAWTLDCARSMREMMSEVFRRSSNEDYTLLLRFVGIDRINTAFLVPEKGFPHSALMRGYVVGRPYGYVREEPQRITMRAADGRTETIEHTWSGRAYSEERGATVFDARTGNVTSARELAECLRRVLFHDELPEAERYRITPDQLAFLRGGGGGLWGLENKGSSSDPMAWTNGVDAVFPNARFFHKTGVISNFALEVAAVDDRATTGKFFIFVPVVAAGSESKPESGQKLISKMSRAIAEWVRDAGHN
jgi:hypothetical protein